MKAIIPTGGRGTRMQPVTFSSNKHFIPVAGKPLILYPIETVRAAGIKEILITYNPESLDQAKSILGDGKKWGVNLTYVLQEKPLGLANIFQVCEEQLKGESFLLHLGDNIFHDGITEFVDYFVKNKPNGLVPIVHHPENWRLGVPFFNKRGQLIKYVEKPPKPPHDFAIPGLYFFDQNVFRCFKGADKILSSARGELEISAPFQWLIDHNYRVEVKEYQGKWLDPGKFNDWIEANQYLLDQNTTCISSGSVDISSKIEGRVEIGSKTKITNSHIRGPVSIGNGVLVKDAYIGPFTSISDQCQIEDCHIENSVVMEGVKISHVRQPIDTSLIGPDSEIISKNNDQSLSLFIGEKCHLTV